MSYYINICFEISHPEAQNFFIPLQSHSSQLIDNVQEISKEVRLRKFFKSRSQPSVNTRLQVVEDIPTASNMGF
jgi:hypothetical protein